MPYVSRWLTTQPMPAMTCETVVDPSAPATFTDTIVAPGATPKWRGVAVPRSRCRRRRSGRP